MLQFNCYGDIFSPFIVKMNGEYNSSNKGGLLIPCTYPNSMAG